MDLELKGKHALITGASKGIGRAVAQRLASEGCHVTLAARTVDALELARRQLQQAYPDVRVDIQAVDLSRTAEQERLAELARDADIFVNNAGSNPGGDLIDSSDSLWREAFDLKVFGYVNLTRMTLGAMKSRGRGVIVNVIGYGGERLMSQYVIGSTANAGLIAFTRTVGSQSPDFGVRVVGVNPGFTATDRAVKILKTWSQKNMQPRTAGKRSKPPPICLSGAWRAAKR